MSAGICPFAQQVQGVTTFDVGHALARVGFCDHVASGYYSTLTTPSFWNGAGISVHFAIAKDGSIAQIVNLFDQAWAQGALGPTQNWTPYALMQAETGSSDPNGWLVSTEHEGFTGEVWTPEMYAADLRLKQWCIAEVAANKNQVKGSADMLRFGLESLTGHYMFDNVNRAQCPGTGWPRQQLWEDLMTAPTFGWQQEGNQYVEYVNGVAVRKHGSVDGQFPGQEWVNEGGVWVLLRGAAEAVTAGEARPAFFSQQAAPE